MEGGFLFSLRTRKRERACPLTQPPLVIPCDDDDDDDDGGVSEYLSSDKGGVDEIGQPQPRPRTRGRVLPVHGPIPLYGLRSFRQRLAASSHYGPGFFGLGCF